MYNIAGNAILAEFFCKKVKIFIAHPYLDIWKLVYGVASTWRWILNCNVSHDHPLRTPFIAPITDSKLVLNSDGHRFSLWVKL